MMTWLPVDFTTKDRYKNPYHVKLESFREVVLPEHDCEKFKNHWNEQVFQRCAPLHLEIGCGGGEFLQHCIDKYPDWNMVGMDFRFKRSFKTAKKLSYLHDGSGTGTSHYIRFVRLWAERAPLIFGEHELDHVYVFFPDHGRKHGTIKKGFFKRLISNSFTVL
jgi:tRNA (guanine-N7-)-methyltransferase